MSRLGWALAGVVVGCLVFGGWQYQKALKYEVKAQAATTAASGWQEQVDSLKRVAAHAAATAAHIDTLTIHDSVLVVQLDRQHPPDTSCAPNVAARDTEIVHLRAEQSDLQAQVLAQIEALAKLQSAKDTLQRTLAARPKVSPRGVFDHLSVQVMLYPQVRVGVGFSFSVGDVLRRVL